MIILSLGKFDLRIRYQLKIQANSPTYSLEYYPQGYKKSRLTFSNFVFFPANFNRLGQEALREKERK